MAANKELLIALARLNASPDFRTVLKYMEADLAEADKSNRKLSGESLYRSQGRAIYIEEFLDRTANARANAEKMRARPNP